MAAPWRIICDVISFWHTEQVFMVLSGGLRGVLSSRIVPGGRSLEGAT